jgi:hypothetical protein
MALCGGVVPKRPLYFSNYNVAAAGAHSWGGRLTLSPTFTLDAQLLIDKAATVFPCPPHARYNRDKLPSRASIQKHNEPQRTSWMQDTLKTAVFWDAPLRNLTEAHRWRMQLPW